MTNKCQITQLPWHLVDVMVTMAGFMMVTESETRLEQIRVRDEVGAKKGQLQMKVYAQLVFLAYPE